MVNGTYGHGENRPDMVYYDPANQLADANLRWEQTAQTDLGFDMSLLENRLGISFDYFIKKTKDLLMNTPLPLYQGGLTRRDSNFGTVLKNVGSVENKGYEFVVNYIPIDTKNITWNVGFNFSAYKNKVTGLGNTEYVEGANGGGVAGNAAPLTRTIVGEPLGTFYGFKFLGIYQENEAAEAAKFGFKPGDSKYFDKNNDNKIDSEDKVVIGHGIPKYSWGLDNTFRYKDFELNLFLQAVSGNDLFNLDYQSTSTIFLDHRAITSADVTPWTAENKNNMWPKLGSSTNNEFLNSSKWVQDGSFIRVKNLSLGYRLPAALTHGASLKLMVSAQNLLTITKFKGYDPEATTTVDDLNPGIVFGAYPSARTFLFTLQLSM